MINWQAPKGNTIESQCSMFSIAGYKLSTGKPESEFYYIAHAFIDDDEFMLGIGSLDECKHWCNQWVNMAHRICGNE